jgi:hypothetical protein
MLSPIPLMHSLIISHRIFWHFQFPRSLHFLNFCLQSFKNKRTQKSLTNLSRNFHKKSLQKCSQSPFPLLHCFFYTRPSSGRQFLAKFAAMVNQEVTLDGAFTNQAIIVFKLVLKIKGNSFQNAFVN